MEPNSFEKDLIAVLDQQLDIVERRIARSGVSYFALSRFDAVVEVDETHLQAFVKNAADKPSLRGALEAHSQFERRVSKMIELHPDLAFDAPRSHRTIRRTGQLVDEIIAAARSGDPSAADWTLTDSEARIQRDQFEDLWQS